MNIEVLARRAQAKWGTISQLDMVVEECSELINAIQKWKRQRYSMDDIVREGVDVEIMIEQLKIIADLPPLWRNVRADKLERLEKRLRQSDDA